ncbi:hypothetical protein AVEN_269078-1 [Araneus ventricosus]|uniref:Uncharacterized protein n=1 Tax=Araneus ventricosus TaxID=182803 RepID=A0A4Y2TX44_ARAVE|nr:hypothetical protein AVEN_269078-1 [Araneus ventricosus]
MCRGEIYWASRRGISYVDRLTLKCFLLPSTIVHYSASQPVMPDSTYISEVLHCEKHRADDTVKERLLDICYIFHLKIRALYMANDWNTIERKANEKLTENRAAVESWQEANKGDPHYFRWAKPRA